eukprot:gene11961-8234_t
MSVLYCRKKLFERALALYNQRYHHLPFFFIILIIDLLIF